MYPAEETVDDAKTILLEFFDIFKKLQNDNKDNIFIRKLKSLDKWILSSKDSLENLL